MRGSSLFRDHLSRQGQSPKYQNPILTRLHDFPVTIDLQRVIVSSQEPRNVMRIQYWYFHRQRVEYTTNETTRLKSGTRYETVDMDRRWYGGDRARIFRVRSSNIDFIELFDRRGDVINGVTSSITVADRLGRQCRFQIEDLERVNARISLFSAHIQLRNHGMEDLPGLRKAHYGVRNPHLALNTETLTLCCKSTKTLLLFATLQVELIV